jgi:hypothetical protein
MKLGSRVLIMKLNKVTLATQLYFIYKLNKVMLSTSFGIGENSQNSLRVAR